MKETHKELLYLLIFTGAGILFTGASIKYNFESHLMIMKFIIILAGFLLSINYAVTLAFLIPIICTLTYENPPAFPDLPIIICETVALTSFSNIYYNFAKLKIYPTLIITLIVGELVLFSAASILSWVIKDFSAVNFTITNFKSTLPGFIIQFAFIPLIVKLTEILKNRIQNNNANH